MTGEDLDTVLRRLAIEAGAEILRLRDDPPARVKADGSPVTEADLAADRLIAAGLAAAFPSIPVVSEEGDATPPASGRWFLVDPLDGTRDFLRGGDDFTVNIALIEDGRPVAGVVHAPAAGRLFLAREGGGAVEERGATDPGVVGEPRPIAAVRADPAALRAAASRSHRDAATDAYLARYAVAGTLRIGSSLKFCLVAAGEADIYPRLGPTMAWDTAAGHAVAEAAGATVRALPGGGPLRYGRDGLRNPDFVVCGPGVALAGGPGEGAQ